MKIWCRNAQELNASGIFISGGGFFPDGTFTGEICGASLEQLKTSGLKYKITIDDITEYYVARNLKSTAGEPKNILYNCGAPKNYDTPVHFGLGSMGGFYTYSEAVAQLDTMRNLFPQLISQKVQIGSSIENRPIYAVKISDNPDSSEAEQQVLFTGVHHACEPASLQQLMFYMYYLLENYNTEPEIKYLVDNLEIFFVPIVNPDGYVYNEQQNPTGGGTWRKNRRPVSLFYGVDLNRNYGYAFGYDELGSSSIPVHPWYRGDSAFSEPESQAMRSLIESQHFSLEMNCHSYGNYLIYPWNYDGSLTADELLFEQYSRYLTIDSHYRYGTCNQTYGYNSNGDADDWAYGDTIVKNKIISLTAEAGSAADGFWPQSANIEGICKTAMDMDIRYCRLAGKFALVNDLSPAFASALQGSLPVEVYCLGMDMPASFTVSITGLSPDIISTDPPVQFNNMSTLEKRYDTLSYSLSPGIAEGTPLAFEIGISNGLYTWKDTLNKIYCHPDTLLNEPADNTGNWNATGFQSTTEQFFSPPSSFTESPGGNYGILQSSSMQLINPVDLTGTDEAYLQFMAEWQIEISYDWAQVLASADNGATWTPLCGKYSRNGTTSQMDGQPVYDGFVPDWVPEEISLKSFTGSPLLLKFTFNSNLKNNYDGIYIDDIRVLAYTDYSSLGQNNRNKNITVFPNPADDILKIKINDKTTASITLLVTDICGKPLISATKPDAEESMEININGLTNGVYLLNILDGNETLFISKIVILH